ncbi:MAG TPA: hypothetical protein VKC54_02170 [Patescibacteria group bacterium]|nr:hypothetical protein [Patescibacteria group bacterium]
MTTEDFVKKWRWQTDPDGTPMVGIVVMWDKIPLDSKVITFEGEDAWKKIMDYAPPWHNEGVVKPFSQWVGSKGFNDEIESERKHGKLKYYEENGLEYPFFCVFATEDGSKGIIGDGNHRFVNCKYLVDQGKDLGSDISRCTLEVLCLKNLPEVIQDAVFPNY